MAEFLQAQLKDEKNGTKSKVLNEQGLQKYSRHKLQAKDLLESAKTSKKPSPEPKQSTETTRGPALKVKRRFEPTEEDEEKRGKFQLSTALSAMKLNDDKEEKQSKELPLSAQKPKFQFNFGNSTKPEPKGQEN